MMYVTEVERKETFEENGTTEGKDIMKRPGKFLLLICASIV